VKVVLSVSWLNTAGCPVKICATYFTVIVKSGVLCTAVSLKYAD
jgi:hypothetical protein